MNEAVAPTVRRSHSALRSGSARDYICLLVEMLDDPLIPLNGATGAAAVIKRTLWEPRAKNDAKVSLGQAYIDGCAVVGCRLGNVFEYIGRADSGCATDGVLGSLRR